MTEFQPIVPGVVHITGEPNEKWKDIPGYSDYQVSSLGALRSRKSGEWQSLKPTPDSDGYLLIRPFPDVGKCKTLKVHHLVLHAFVGVRPDGMICCHNNNVKCDNRVSNLRWDTHKGNSRDAMRDGISCGSRNGMSKLTEDQVKSIRVLNNGGLSTAELSKMFAVTRSNVWYITTGRTWKHV